MSSWVKLLAGFVALVVGATALFFVLRLARKDPPDAARCPGTIGVYFRTDDEMRQNVDRFSKDPRFRLVSKLTKHESYEKYQRIFANEPELLRLPKPDSLPAYVEVFVVPGVERAKVFDELKTLHPGPGDVMDLCVDPLGRPI